MFSDTFRHIMHDMHACYSCLIYFTQDSATVGEDTVTTIYVSGFKETTSQDAISMFFESKKRSGGGDLREGENGFKRLSPTVARLTFVSSKGTCIVYWSK